MAHTKRKRRTKHRGTAAGTVAQRGRTGRKPTAAEVKRDPKAEARARRLARLDQPPTWSGAAKRAAVAAVFFFVAALLLFRGQSIASKVVLSVFMLGIYLPMSYYIDLFIYRRRQKRKARESGKGAK